MNTNPSISRSTQSGMSLIEVVVAIVVLSLGALGIAGLQARALKGNESSLQRTQAVISANYMIDAMHANVVPVGSVDRTCAGNATRFGEWINDMQTNLAPEACGTIVCAENEPSPGITRCTVTVDWNDQRAGGAAAQQLSLSALFS